MKNERGEHFEPSINFCFIFLLADILTNSTLKLNISPIPNESNESSNSGDNALTFDVKVIHLLRDMRSDTVSVFVGRILQLNIFTEERSTTVIELVVSRAVHFTKFATVYVRFCKQIIEKENELSTTNTSFSFKKLLLNKCHDLFTKEILRDDSSNKRKSERWKRCLGITRFVGVLYMHQLLFANIIEWVVGSLLDFATEDKLEYLYELLAIVGKRMELKTSNTEHNLQWYRDLSSYFEILERITKDSEHQSEDTRNMLHDLVGNRKNGWNRQATLLLGDYGLPINKKNEKPNNYDNFPRFNNNQNKNTVIKKHN